MEIHALLNKGPGRGSGGDRTEEKMNKTGNEWNMRGCNRKIKRVYELQRQVPGSRSPENAFGDIHFNRQARRSHAVLQRGVAS